ncbi:M14 family zinc carboxypeptidase [Hyunsoonleella aestuarii]|uniref:M14 family metallopeptidase n=1 Tax=Hyunsoonleella aestuarii TaxID=912802 RepID=A0ABP8EDB3_9FLAO|nr:M14 family zinc carboxypeptidase [Hyunsoonleella aestuarii]
MDIELIKELYLKNKEESLFHRYITNDHVSPLLQKRKGGIDVNTIGKSVFGEPIYGFKIGNGNKRILMWSQMHGNESTTTKALFDLINTFLDSTSDVDYILSSCTIYIIPILNPDGARAYTRINANEIDLNRDAQNLTQPESRVLRKVFEDFNPHFCYNLHGQRTIFSAGKTSNSATVSFLAPAQDEICTITPNRKVAMEVISVMNKSLQKVIPQQIGVYDDAFNINCVGDTFQSQNVPTILFEAGHSKDDYARDKTRELIYLSYLVSLDYISRNSINGLHYKDYFDIPENDKCFLDVIIRNAKVEGDNVDIGIQFQENLVDNRVTFLPRVEKIENLNELYGHLEIEASGCEVLAHDGKTLKIGYENVCVILNNEKILLLSK